MNPIGEELEDIEGIQQAFFAYDFTFIAGGKDIKDIQHRLQKALNVIMK